MRDALFVRTAGWAVCFVHPFDLVKVAVERKVLHAELGYLTC